MLVFALYMDRRPVAGALTGLHERLAVWGVVSADEAEEALKIIARSSEISAARASSPLTIHPSQRSRNLQSRQSLLVIEPGGTGHVQEDC